MFFAGKILKNARKMTDKISAFSQSRKFSNSIFFSRIEKKFRWNQNQKVWILISANLLTYQTALPCVKLSTKITASRCEMMYIKFSNVFQSDHEVS